MESLHENPSLVKILPGQTRGPSLSCKADMWGWRHAASHWGLGVTGNSDLDRTVKFGSVGKNHIINFDVVCYLVIL